MHFPIYKAGPPLLIPLMLWVGQQGKSGRVSHLHFKVGICYLEFICSNACVCLSRHCPRPEEMPRKWKEPLLAVILHCVTGGEPARGTLGDSNCPLGFGVVLFFLTKYLWVLLAGLWLEAVREREHQALKMTKHFHLREPSKEGGNEHIFLRESNFTSPACVQMSRTVKGCRMASDIPGEMWMIDVFSLRGLGGSFMQNSEKERNPSLCPPSFHEGLPWTGDGQMWP